MNINGDIIIVDDDPQHWEVLLEVFDAVLLENKYDNTVIIFEDSTMVLDHILNAATPPFFILAKIDMPLQSGPLLKQRLHSHAELSAMQIPVILADTLTTQYYKLPLHGLKHKEYFVVPQSKESYIIVISELIKSYKNATPSAN